MDICTVLVIGKESLRRNVATIIKRSEYHVIETTDFKDLDNSLLSARGWISSNSLRRLNEPEVKVVCCIGDIVTDKKWVQIAGLVFNDSHSSIVIVTRNAVQSYDEYIQGVLSNHVLYLTGNPNNNLKNDIQNAVDGACPLEIRTCTSLRADSPLHPWSSEKVILFGRTGSGKSTIANMLAFGNLDTESGSKVDSSARGVNSKIAIVEGRGWRIVDTPGFGEGHEGTINTKRAEAAIKKFVKNSCGTYSHFIYVIKKDRLSDYDRTLWPFFKSLFKGAENNITVVVTNYSGSVTESNEKFLREVLDGCSNIVYVNFRPVDEDEELEQEAKRERLRSLERLEKSLAELCLSDTTCEKGQFSRDCISTKLSILRTSGQLSTLRFIIITTIGVIGRFIGNVLMCAKGWLGRSDINEGFGWLPK